MMLETMGSLCLLVAASSLRGGGYAGGEDAAKDGVNAGGATNRTAFLVLRILLHPSL